MSENDVTVKFTQHIPNWSDKDPEVLYGTFQEIMDSDLIARYKHGIFHNWIFQGFYITEGSNDLMVSYQTPGENKNWRVGRFETLPLGDIDMSAYQRYATKEVCWMAHPNYKVAFFLGHKQLIRDEFAHQHDKFMDLVASEHFNLPSLPREELIEWVGINIPLEFSKQHPELTLLVENRQTKHRYLVKKGERYEI